MSSRRRPRPQLASNRASEPAASAVAPAVTRPEAVLTWRTWVIFAALTAVVLWAYWPAFAAMSRKWGHDPQYSHGYLVPLFSVFLLWFRRGTAVQGSSAPNWLGALLLLAGVALYLAGGFWFFDWFTAISLIPTLAGLALLLGGWAMFRRSWLAIAFLVFMVPLPHRIETALSQPLRSAATAASTYLLQTIGLPAVAEGNVIAINDAQIGVVDACNGLGMLLLFIAMATGLAIVIRRPWWIKGVLFASSIPIAVAANVLRISVAGVLMATTNSEWASTFFHDLAGWFMMPTALAMLWLELFCLDRLFIEVEVRRPRPLVDSLNLTKANDLGNRNSPSPVSSAAPHKPDAVVPETLAAGE